MPTKATMKYTAAVIVLACLAAIFVGDGWVKTKRAGQKAQSLTATVSALSPQDLAARVRDCEAAGQPSQARPPYDAAYCAEVMRVIDDRPLQMVTPQRMPDPVR
jgi:hypothetical protein